MRVLVACEFSGVVRRAFRNRHYDAWSCDLLPAEDGSEFHRQQDVLDILGEGWDLMIAHPPCTYLANSGVQWLEKYPERWEKMHEARAFFMSMLLAPIPHIAIENPVAHKYAKLPDYDQIIEPYYFGDEATKRTCLWLKALPPLKADKIVDKGPRYIGKDGKSNGAQWYQLAPIAERAKVRSKMFPGIARAMAEQWTEDCEYQLPLLELAEVA